MSGFYDNIDQGRFEMPFDSGGAQGLVWADYVREGDILAIPHVEAEPQLRGSGAAGQFMQAMTDHTRDAGLKLKPICAYAVLWHRRHPDSHDVVVWKR